MERESKSIVRKVKATPAVFSRNDGRSAFTRTLTCNED